MFQYQHQRLKEIFSGIISSQVSPETFRWLYENASPGTTVDRLGAAFVSAPRKTGRKPLILDDESKVAIDEARPHLTIDGWTTDRLIRVWLLLQLDVSDKDKYYHIIENLVRSAEVNELVAVYSALPVLAFPDLWKARCSEGIRSNIGDVLTAIMCHNPYPAENLNEAAWNQLVLKAFFTDKAIEEIIGIDLRANRDLAYTLSDYAHERWAAGRSVNPQLWRCVSPFLDDGLLPDLKKIAASTDPLEKEAAALMAYWSDNESAKKMISPEQLQSIESGESSWDMLAQKTKNYVL